MAKGLWNGGEGEGGVAPRGCPWESAEDPLLGEGRLGVLWWEGRLRAQALAKKGSLREGFWKPAEGEGAEAAGRRFRSLGSELAPGCSWLLAGAINLAAAGDLDAWHSRAAGLFCSRPVPLRSLPCVPDSGALRPQRRPALGFGRREGEHRGCLGPECGEPAKQA